jgi:hypothetical protein
MEMVKTASGWNPQLGLSSYALLQESAALLVRLSLQVRFKAAGFQVSGMSPMKALDEIDMALAWLEAQQLAFREAEETPLTPAQKAYVRWCQGFHVYIDQSLTLILEDVMAFDTSQPKVQHLYNTWSLAMLWGKRFHQNVCLLRSSYLEILAEGATPSERNQVTLELMVLCEVSLRGILAHLQGYISPLSSHWESRSEDDSLALS